MKKKVEFYLLFSSSSFLGIIGLKLKAATIWIEVNAAKTYKVFFNPTFSNKMFISFGKMTVKTELPVVTKPLTVSAKIYIQFCYSKLGKNMYRVSQQVSDENLKSARK